MLDIIDNVYRIYEKKISVFRRNNNMATTLKDIASLVGVSVNTVSRALKDKSDIGEQTRQRIKDAAAALGYRPNLNARSLVLRKSATIGVAVSEADNPVRMEFCEKLRRLAELHGYRVLNAGISIHGNASDVDTLQDLLARGVDALVIGNLSGILAELPVGKVLQECRDNHIPVTVFGSPETGLADCVNIDFHESSSHLTAYLIGRGLSPVVFFGEAPDTPRLLGYLKTMHEHGMDAAASSWPIHGHRLGDGYEAMDAFLQNHNRPPQAVIAPNDLTAIGIISCLKKHGYRVPEDVSVAGFDNIELGEYYDPPLTSIGFSNGSFAEAVWELLHFRLNSGTAAPPRIIRLRQELMVRGSCK